MLTPRCQASGLKDGEHLSVVLSHRAVMICDDNHGNLVVSPETQPWQLTHEGHRGEVGGQRLSKPGIVLLVGLSRKGLGGPGTPVWVPRPSPSPLWALVCL